MTSLLKRTFFTLGFLGLLSTASYAAPETYKLDPMHSAVTWHISHFGFSNPSGKWYATGTIVMDEAAPEKSKVDVTIKVADIVTGIPKLDEHLKGKEFFDVVKFPEARFVSKKIEITGQSSAKIDGLLTVHGVTKPVVLDVEMNKVGLSPITHKKTLGFTASTTLKRADFGLNSFLPGLGNEVKIEIEVEANH